MNHIWIIYFLSCRSNWLKRSSYFPRIKSRALSFKTLPLMANMVGEGAVIGDGAPLGDWPGLRKGGLVIDRSLGVDTTFLKGENESSVLYKDLKA